MDINIIDCTIRDGGHLNNWQFDTLCVAESYKAALLAGIEYFEIGYRNPPLKNFGYCSDKLLAGLTEFSDQCKLLVMVDADVAEEDLFKECTTENTPVKGIRVAAYPDHLENAVKFAEIYKERGYEIFLQLMAFSELEKSHFKSLEDWNNKDILKAVYFADSFGSFLPSDIPDHIKHLREMGFDKIGFHAHNNLQLALANTLRAIEEGVDFVDASIYGMGRGAGNLPVEILTGTVKKYNPVPYINVIKDFYLDLFKKYQWGYGISTLISGLKNIHPYYTEELFARNSYTVEEIWNSTDTIKENCPVSYSLEVLSRIIR